MDGEAVKAITSGREESRPFRACYGYQTSFIPRAKVVLQGNEPATFPAGTLARSSIQQVFVNLSWSGDQALFNRLVLVQLLNHFGPTPENEAKVAFFKTQAGRNQLFSLFAHGGTVRC